MSILRILKSSKHWRLEQLARCGDGVDCAAGLQRRVFGKTLLFICIVPFYNGLLFMKKVCLVRYKLDKKVYAMKILKKTDLLTRREVRCSPPYQIFQAHTHYLPRLGRLLHGGTRRPRLCQIFRMDHHPLRRLPGRRKPLPGHGVCFGRQSEGADE